MKKYVLILLMFCLVTLCIPAATIATAEEANCTIRGEDVVALPDSDVTMAISIENNPGIAGAELVVSFDERLTLVSAEAGDAFSALTYVEPSYYRNPTIFVWDSEKLNEEDIKDGIILELTFHTPDGVEDDFPVTITYESGNVFDKDLNPMELTIDNGCITSISYLPGDADGNGRINTLDITSIRRYISDGRKTDPNGYNVVINENAADVDANGRINTLDITMIRRYISDGRITDPNGYNITLMPGNIACAHTLTNTAAESPTCTESGNIAYWSCASCGKYFSDEAASVEIALEDTIIDATGHKEVIDEAVSPTYDSAGLTEGSHCSVCGTVLVEQQIIEKLEPIYYSITYSNLQGAEPPELDEYASHIGVSRADMPKPERKGYEFVGWFDENGGEVACIDAGTVGNIELTAEWDIIVYTISYDLGNATNSPNNVDSGRTDKSYTIESKTFTLASPTLAGYHFVGWVDEEGQFITQISEGSTGDIHLTPKWSSITAIIYPYSQIETPSYDGVEKIETSEGKILYIYYMGYIANIPTGTADDATIVDYNGTGEVALELSESNSTTTSTTTYGRIVSSKTSSWEKGFTSKVESKLGVDNVASVSGSIEGHHFEGESETTTHESGQDIVSGSVSETVKSQTYTLTPDKNPVGYYWFSIKATVDVFALVEYDPINQTIKYDTARVWRNTYTAGWTYAATVDEIKTANISGDYDDFFFEVPDEFFDDVAMLSFGSEGLIKFENGTECSIMAYIGTDTDVIVPTYLNGCKVTSIDSNAFAGNTSITSVTLGEGVTEIPDGAFQGCTSLVSLITDGEITSIGANAFNGCASLEYEIPNTVTYIGDSAFEGCELLNSVTLTDAVTSLGTAIFNNCGDLFLTVNSSNLSVIKNAVSSGATEVYVNWTGSSASVIEAGCIITVPAIQTFMFNGNRQTFHDLSIKSDAATTTVEYVTISYSYWENAFEFSSPTVCLRVVDVISTQTPLVLSAESTELTIGSSVTLKATNGYDGLIANGLTISAINEAAELNVIGSNGNPGGNGMTINGDLSFNGYIIAMIQAGSGDAGTKDAHRNGANGGIGISADNISFSAIGEIEVYGGAGGAANDREIGENDDDGSNGRDGYSGGAGGAAIKAATVTINSGTLTATGGNGGEGGNASECNIGGPWTGDVKGGRGGNGGNGGTAISANLFVVSDTASNISVTLTGGNGGNTGRPGGCHSDTHNAWNQHAFDGDNGTPGSASVYSSGCEVIDLSSVIVAVNGINGNVDTEVNQC